MPLTELNTDAVECGGQVSPDGLIYYFDSTIGGSSDLYVSLRSDANSPFEPASALAELNTGATEADPATTPDELELYFTSDRDGANCIYRARRSTPAASWDPPVRLDAVCGDPAVGPSVSQDGLTLFYNRIEAEGFLGTVMVTTRPSRSDEFPTGTPVPTLSLSSDRAYGYPSLAPDGLTIYVSAGGAELDIWQATRLSVAEAFGVPTPLLEINGPTLDGDASVTAGGTQLFFSSGRAGTLDLFLSTRSCP